MWRDRMLLPASERGAVKHFAGGLCILALGFALLYFGNLQVARVAERLEGKSLGVLLVGSTFGVIVHASQLLFVLLAWVTIGDGAGYCFSRFSLAARLVVSFLGIWTSFALPPMLSPDLAYTFPLNSYAFLLLSVLLQILTLHVENWLDRSAAMMLWVYSFQSLELLPVFPTGDHVLFQGTYLSGQGAVIASIAGTAMFLSFMAGAVISTWVLASYSYRLGQVRHMWNSEKEAGDESGGLRGVSMLDIRNLVHDLRNPLAAIKGMAFTFKGSADAGTAENGEVVLKAANYMERMIAEILDEDSRRHVLVESFFDELEKHVRPFPWGENVSVRIDGDAARLSLLLNEMRFMRALLNVLDNAWRANLIAGKQKIAVKVRGGPQFLEIEVLDNGPGYVNNGTSFQRSGWGSSGLGLAFARKTVAAHGGSLLLAQRADGINGASVLISIPVSSA